MTRDPVTSALRLAVFERDRELLTDFFLEEEGIRPDWLGEWMLLDGIQVCPAVYIDPNEVGKCRGRWTIEHVKDEPRLGVRAKSDPAHLISLCEGHTENGMKAGHQWNTANRPALRAYLREVAA